MLYMIFQSDWEPDLILIGFQAILENIFFSVKLAQNGEIVFTGYDEKAQTLYQRLSER